MRIIVFEWSLLSLNIFRRFFVLLYVCSCVVSNFKKCFLELGGKLFFIIFLDCDMDRVVR